MTHSLVGLFAAAPWVLCALDGVEVSVERDFLRSHLDKDGGFGLVGEVFIEIIDMSVKSHARYDCLKLVQSKKGIDAAH